MFNVCPYQIPPHILEYYPFRLQPKQFSCQPSNILPKTSYPYPHISTSHLHIFARRLPIIIFPTLNISKPSKIVISYHLSYGLNTQTAAQFLTWLICFSLCKRHNACTGGMRIKHTKSDWRFEKVLKRNERNERIQWEKDQYMNNIWPIICTKW